MSSSKRPPGKGHVRYETPIPPPPDTQPEGVGVVITEPEGEPGGAEDYYKRIHAHRTVLAMKAARLPEAMAVMVDDESDEQKREGAQVLLRRVFEAERTVVDLRERLAEAMHERDAAKGEVIVLLKALRDFQDTVAPALTRLADAFRS